MTGVTASPTAIIQSAVRCLGSSTPNRANQLVSAGTALLVFQW